MKKRKHTPTDPKTVRKERQKEAERVRADNDRVAALSPQQAAEEGAQWLS